MNNNTQLVCFDVPMLYKPARGRARSTAFDDRVSYRVVVAVLAGRANIKYSLVFSFFDARNRCSLGSRQTSSLHHLVLLPNQTGIDARIPR
jgi:hypothetical protein